MIFNTVYGKSGSGEQTGPVYLFYESAEWSVPEGGYYDIELHAKGGKGDASGGSPAGGAGSGERRIRKIAAGSSLSISVSDELTTVAGSLHGSPLFTDSVAKGGDGMAGMNMAPYGGDPSGNIAQEGAVTGPLYAGGTGGGRYGDRFGRGGYGMLDMDEGYPPAVILTFIGEDDMYYQGEMAQWELGR